MYWDHAASTPLDPAVKAVILECLDHDFANPHGRHPLAKQARARIEAARQVVAGALGVEPESIIWTSGATEANNLALKGVAGLSTPLRHEVLTTSVAHASVLQVCRSLGKFGLKVRVLPVNAKGQLESETLERALSSKTLLVSLLHVNNELGTIQDLKALREMSSAAGALLHIDAAQSLGRIQMGAMNVAVDLMSLSAHKAYGPKGVGALLCRPDLRTRLWPLIEGGGQEQGLRAGTLATALIVGMGEAFRLAEQHFARDHALALALRTQLLAGILNLKQICLNTDLESSVPGILNLRFDETLPIAWVLKLCDELNAATGAACSSGLKASHVLAAIGLSASSIERSLRLSFGRFTTMEELKTAVYLLKQVCEEAI